MADKVFSGPIMAVLRSDQADGLAMIATSRAILDNQYSDGEYEKEFMSIFILIDEEFGHISLSGYGEYNIASARSAIDLEGGRFRVGDDPRKPFFSNYKIYADEIESMENAYRETYLSSVMQFKSYYNVA
jgi:hypothetical protein